MGRNKGDSPPKTFSDYYKDPEFRKRHQAYMKTKVTCSCGKSVMRVNLSRHRKSAFHLENVNNTDVKQEVEELKETVKQLKQLLTNKTTKKTR